MTQQDDLANKIRREIMHDTSIGESLKYAELLSERLGILEELVPADRIEHLEQCRNLLSKIRWSVTDSFKSSPLGGSL